MDPVPSDLKVCIFIPSGARAGKVWLSGSYARQAIWALSQPFNFALMAQKQPGKEKHKQMNMTVFQYDEFWMLKLEFHKFNVLHFHVT